MPKKHFWVPSETLQVTKKKKTSTKATSGSLMLFIPCFSCPASSYIQKNNKKTKQKASNIQRPQPSTPPWSAGDLEESPSSQPVADWWLMDTWTPLTLKKCITRDIFFRGNQEIHPESQNALKHPFINLPSKHLTVCFLKVYLRLKPHGQRPSVANSTKFPTTLPFFHLFPLPNGLLQTFLQLGWCQQAVPVLVQAHEGVSERLQRTKLHPMELFVEEFCFLGEF